MKKKIHIVTVEADSTGHRMAYVHQIPRTDDLMDYVKGAEIAVVLPSYKKAAIYAAECNAQFRELCGEPIKFRAIAVYD